MKVIVYKEIEIFNGRWVEVKCEFDVSGDEINEWSEIRPAEGEDLTLSERAMIAELDARVVFKDDEIFEAYDKEIEKSLY